ncbi:MAG: hypothetical protein AAB668_02535 [Patescibacteria group bacterium]
MNYVFYIDDDKNLRGVLSRVFRSWTRSSAVSSVELRVAESTKHLFSLLRETKEDDRIFLITDGNMKSAAEFGMDGDKLIEAVRAAVGDRLVRVTIMTGNAKEFLASAKRLGAELLDKPFDSDALKQIIVEFGNS